VTIFARREARLKMKIWCGNVETDGTQASALSNGYSLNAYWSWYCANAEYGDGSAKPAAFL
jgi:hypothetical protein